MGLLTYDESAWPLVRVTWGSAVPTDADVADLLSHLEGYLGRRERFGVVLDSRAGVGVNAKQRQMFADFMKTHTADLRAYCSIALVLATALQRGLLTAINWITPPAAEQKVFADDGPAEEWCRSRLGLPARTRSA